MMGRSRIVRFVALASWLILSVGPRSGLYSLDSPLAEQILSMREITTLSAEVSKRIGNEPGPFLQTIIIKGHYSRVYERPGDGWKKPEGNKQVGTIWSETKTGLSNIDLSTGEMEILRRDPLDGKLKGPSLIKNRANPALLEPFNFLDIDDMGIPSDGSISWIDLWDDTYLTGLFHRLIKSVRDDHAGGTWLTEPIRSPFANADGTITSRDLGGYYQIHISKVPGIGINVVTEIRYYKTASESEPNSINTYTYQLVRFGTNRVPVLLHSEGKERGQNTPFESIDVISVKGDEHIDEVKLEIDPSLASSIHDGSTGVVIEPER